MKKQLLVVSLSSLLVFSSLSGCSSSAPRITPGNLKISESVNTTSAKIVNIVQLSEKEVSLGKELLGGLTGAIIGAAISSDSSSDTVQYISTDVGGAVGENLVKDKYGKTIYKLTLKLADGSLKQIHLRGGIYTIGQVVKITIDKKKGNITSLKTG